MIVSAVLLAVLPAVVESVAITAVPIPLEASVPAQETVGRLRYRGGLALASADARFGGISSLDVADDDSFVAITDGGHWLSGGLLHTAGRLVGVAGGSLGALGGLDGAPLRGKLEHDAEALALLPGGQRLIAFERRHRLLAYASGDSAFGAGQSFPAPPGLDLAPGNRGIEALTALHGGELLALTEGLMVEGGVRGWVGGPSCWRPFTLRLQGSGRPAAAATLPNGDVVVVLRSYTPMTGPVVELRLIPRTELQQADVVGQSLAELRHPLNVDNFEGLAARRGEAGQTLLYLISDDNFSPLQRTLLMLFELLEE